MIQPNPTQNRWTPPIHVWESYEITRQKQTVISGTLEGEYENLLTKNRDGQTWNDIYYRMTKLYVNYATYNRQKVDLSVTEGGVW